MQQPQPRRPAQKSVLALFCRAALPYCLVVSLLLTGVGAKAGVLIVPMPLGPIVPYGPFFYRPQPYMQYAEQYYPLTLGGLQSLCSVHPEACGEPSQQEALRSLRDRRAAGIGMVVGGIAAAVGGTIWTVSTTRYDTDGFVTQVNYAPLIVGLSMGIALPMVGGIIMPHGGDIVDFVNQGNALHPDGPPMQLHLGYIAPKTPGLTLSMRL